MKVMCRIKFHIKHFYFYHVALAFANFATCILRGSGILMLVLYFIISVDYKTVFCDV